MGGGKATSAGIDYQQRIAAWFQIHMYAEFDISIFFDQLNEKLIIKSVEFESDNPIDDINLICENNSSIFIQVKRSISLSTQENSDFYKTIYQFVKEFVKDELTTNLLGLVTTSDASNKITNDLKKLVVGARLNMGSIETLPLNNSEKDTLQKVKIVFTTIYTKEKGLPPPDFLINEFLKRIFIGVIDIQQGQYVEIASYMILNSLGFKKPELIWSVLIKNALYYSSNRLIIDKNQLQNILKRYLPGEKENKYENEIELLKTNVIQKGFTPTGKEVLLIESFLDNADFLIVELYRFKGNCEFKATFYDDKIEIKDNNTWTIIQRFASMKGCERYMIENKDKYKDKTVSILPAREIETVEESECAKLHREIVNGLLKKNKDVFNCLHCGKIVNDKKTLLVEIQDLNSIPAVGTVHHSCIRPIDRILGITQRPDIQEEEILSSFDYRLWLRLLLKGQGLMNNLKKSPELLYGRSPIITWNSDDEYDADYSYCIKFILEDGSSSYAHDRGKIARVNILEAREQVELFKNTQETQKGLNDPLCVLLSNKVSAPHSELLKMKKADDEIVEIIDIEISKYSRLVAKLYDKDIFYYAPLCLVRDKETEVMIGIGEIVPLISNPLEFKNYFNNWKDLGIDFDEVELKIIKSDRDFDYYMRRIFKDNLVPVIDPVFSKNLEMIRGIPILEFDKFINKEKE